MTTISITTAGSNEMKAFGDEGRLFTIFCFLPVGPHLPGLSPALHGL